MKKYLVFPLIILMPLLGLVAQSAQDYLDAGIRQEKILQEPQALKNYERCLEVDSGSFDCLWRASFMYSQIGNRQGNSDLKKAYFKKAVITAQKAATVNPNDGMGHYVLAIAYGRTALVASSKEKVASTHKIKNSVSRALELDPENAGSWFVLALWNFEVANLNFFERGAADLLFGGLPEGATNDEAIRCVKKAIEIDPNYILYYLDLARFYVKTDKNELAKSTLKYGLSLRNKTLDDPKIKTKMNKLLEGL